MVKNLKRFKRQYERDQNKAEAAKWDFFPTTFVLPSEYHMFVEEFKRKPGTIWIMKPAGRAQGKGIFLFTDLKDITDWKKVCYNCHEINFEHYLFQIDTKTASILIVINSINTCIH